MEAEFHDGGDNLCRPSEAALADDSGCYHGINLVFCVVLRFLEHIDDVEDERPVGDSSERAFIHTLSARDTFVVVDFRLFVFINRDSFNLTACHTWAVLHDDSRVGAGFRAFAALYTFLLIHNGVVVYY